MNSKKLIEETFNMVWTYQQFNCYLPPLENAIDKILDPMLQAFDNIQKNGDEYSQRIAEQALLQIKITLKAGIG